MTDYPEPSVKGIAHGCIFARIHGRVVEMAQSARLMAFQDGIIADFVRPPSSGKRATLVDVAGDDLEAIDEYWEKLLGFCKKYGQGINSWDHAVDVEIIDVRTGETSVGYFDGAEEQPDGRFTVKVFLPDVRA